jgi:hypothetical protein
LCCLAFIEGDLTVNIGKGFESGVGMIFVAFLCFQTQTHFFEQSLTKRSLLYTAPSGAVKIEVIFEGETFWLSQRKMGALFGVEVQTINYHLKEIFKSGKLEEEATIRKIRIVQTEVSR